MRTRTSAVALTVAAALALPATSAYAAPNPKPASSAAPSAADITAAKAKAKQTADKLAQTTAELRSVQAQLTAAGDAAELAIAKWEAMSAKAQQAQQALAAAQSVADAADARLASYRTQLNAYAIAAYEDGGPIADLAALLNATNPADVLTRSATLQALGRGQGDIVHEFAAASGVADQARATAAAASATAQKMLADTDSARQKAAAAVAVAQQLLAKMQTAKQQLTAAVGKDKKKVDQLVAARAQALAAARAAAARALAAQLRSLAPVQGFPPATPQQGLLALKWAQSQLGVPYSWGGGDVNGPTLGFAEGNGITAGEHTVGFDCSGLTMYAWAHAGYVLGHWTGAQWTQGISVAKKDLRPGDLVFFATDITDPSTIHHVGIYAGNGLMIDAPETGSFVRYDPAFNAEYIGAVRP